MAGQSKALLRAACLIQVDSSYSYSYHNCLITEYDDAFQVLLFYSHLAE